MVTSEATESADQFDDDDQDEDTKEQDTTAAEEAEESEEDDPVDLHGEVHDDADDDKKAE